jgi:hypothetical protein
LDFLPASDDAGHQRVALGTVLPGFGFFSSPGIQPAPA